MFSLYWANKKWGTSSLILKERPLRVPKRAFSASCYYLAMKKFEKYTCCSHSGSVDDPDQNNFQNYKNMKQDLF